MSSQYTRTIIIYTFFPLSIYLKTLNKIWYLNLNKKNSSNRLRFVKLFIFKFCHFLWGELVIFLKTQYMYVSLHILLAFMKTGFSNVLSQSIYTLKRNIHIDNVKN